MTVTGRPRPASRPPVMADVARLAGVSPQTVSRVVNDSPLIRPETRARVQQAIDRLGYRPNSAARALVRGRTDVIGVISTGAAHFGPTSIQRTIEDAARAAGLFASTVSLPELTRTLLADSVEHLMRVPVVGIIVIAGQDEALEVARTAPVGVPVVVVEGDLTRARWTVGVDQEAGARMATEHLLALGHREIAHLGGPLDWAEARARRDGWRAAMLAAGLRPPEPVHTTWSAAGGFGSTEELLARSGPRRPVTAVFAASDQIAIGLLAALHRSGRRVPDDVSVVGFDGLPETPYLTPALTTVQQDFPAVGRASIAVLLEAIDGRDPHARELILPELVVRDSTAPAPRRTGRRSVPTGSRPTGRGQDTPR
ncbi:DNA-binding LacI/PurR family transcriptional regulator [Friedmanniella endophytica]|uniref:DNA-binding LacI/PurR family transcriptional regulator n=1 Tax=Microlunatus kandeliicorticis TaxID=1759536 RepID=A0A7W3IRX4_9ACTN|nr:DNA-binding LacI/PurR family transcriptional regulator [Microlunatus kandeliicorticis]